jgi:hypothetical protein
MTTTATIARTIAAMMERGGDRAYNKNKCSDGIVGTNERGGRLRLGGMIPTDPS